MIGFYTGRTHQDRTVVAAGASRVYQQQQPPEDQRPRDARPLHASQRPRSARFPRRAQKTPDRYLTLSYLCCLIISYHVRRTYDRQSCATGKRNFKISCLLKKNPPSFVGNNACLQ